MDKLIKIKNGNLSKFRSNAKIQRLFDAKKDEKRRLICVVIIKLNSVSISPQLWYDCFGEEVVTKFILFKLFVT